MRLKPDRQGGTVENVRHFDDLNVVEDKCVELPLMSEQPMDLERDPATLLLSREMKLRKT